MLLWGSICHHVKREASRFIPSILDVCIRDPGFEVDLVIRADIGALARVWVGHLGWAEAVRSGGIKLDGARALVQAFPGWLLLSHFAQVVRPARAG